ncbi:MAG: hypothetical protein OXF02_01540 [Simkaniaceae bacterium]|nr:hypothetical protein [Simkaniaceae bacterium]
MIAHLYDHGVRHVVPFRLRSVSPLPPFSVRDISFGTECGKYLFHAIDQPKESFYLRSYCFPLQGFFFSERRTGASSRESPDFGRRTVEAGFVNRNQEHPPP